jgi:glycosyltransferase involved in cell wall biosynthesis
MNASVKMQANEKIIIVTPVYEDLEASSKLFSEIGKEFGDAVKIVAVDDGSVHTPLDISALENANVKGVLLKLRRNVGHQRAIAIGLSHISRSLSNEVVVVMDSDGEDIPSSIVTLLDGLKKDDVDVVVAQRKSRVESIRFKVFYQVYRRLFHLLTGRSISFGNFMALKPHAVHRLVTMQELPIHVAGSVIASKLRTFVSPIDRGARYAGQSKMNFVGLALHGFKGLMVFAEDVLVRVGITCAVVASGSILGATVAVLLKLFGYSTPGWFSVALGILVLMFLQTGALALMTLLLTGVVRSGSVATTLSYDDFIDSVTETGPKRSE